MRAVALIAVLSLAACHGVADTKGVAASGSGGARSYAVDGFSKVAATGPDDVDVRVGAGFSVRAEGDPAVLDQLEIVKNGDTLEVRRKSGVSWGGQSAKVHVTMPRIVAAELTGSGDIAIDHVDGDAFSAHATGSGDLDVASLAVQRLDIDLTGSGGAAVAGTATAGKFSIAGSGDIDAPKLTLKQADVKVLGAGGVSAAVAGPATVDVMGSGDVTLTGGAQCTTSNVGSGDINCR